MESSHSRGWTAGTGLSLPVPNVQALAASGELAEVPKRYVRSEAVEDEVWGEGDDGYGELPVIDMAKLRHPLLCAQEAERLKVACEDWGFFQLVNHGIPDEVMEKAKSNLKRFFEQELEVRLRSAQPPGSVEGYGQAFVVSEDQKLDWSDMLFLYTNPPASINTPLWPSSPPTFREALICYSQELRKVAYCLFGSIAANLGLGATPEKFMDLFVDGFQMLRMNYYPPCPLGHGEVLGISPHSDAVGLTLLLQVGEVHALQIRRKGKWLPICPPEGSLIANIGDVLEVVSNGRCRSVEHRAMISKDKERMSIAGFHTVKADALVGPLPQLLHGSDNQQPVFRTLTYQEFEKMLFSLKLDGKKFLDALRLPN